MVDRTQSTQHLSRDELAAYLSGVASEFERGDETVAVEVGNKTVTLTPPDEIATDVEVVERSSVIRGRREKLTIELSWKP